MAGEQHIVLLGLGVGRGVADRPGDAGDVALEGFDFSGVLGDGEDVAAEWVQTYAYVGAIEVDELVVADEVVV